MLDASTDLGGTIRIEATPNGGRIAAGRWNAIYLPAALRAAIGKLERDFRASPLCQNHSHDGGNHFPGFLNRHSVANPDVFAPQFIFVMERGAGDGAAGQKDRFELRHGG